MSLGIVATLGVMAGAVLGLVSAERAGGRPLKWLCKPVASTAFVALGIFAGDLTNAYGRWVMAALVLGWLGDVLLLGRGKAPFLLGLGSFLIGHAAFGAGFVVRGVVWTVVLMTAGLLVYPGLRLWAWMAPAIPTNMRLPVKAYLTIISAMVALAAGTTYARPGVSILVAALMFAASDVSVARDRFMGAGWQNKAWGLPLYYAAQCILALTAGAP